MFSAATLRSPGLRARLTTVPRPGYMLSHYPERTHSEAFSPAIVRRQWSAWIAPLTNSFKRFDKRALRIEQETEALLLLDTATFEARTMAQRQALRSKGLEADTILNALALVNAAVKKSFGFTLHREQLYAAWLLLNAHLPEMATGEGKTITAAAAASVAAMTGLPVHVITTNDYLVERDACNMRKLFDCFGLSCDYATAGKSDTQRAAAYSADVCYVTNKQIVFDYLRDRQAVGPRPASIQARVKSLSRIDPPTTMLRGLCFAIVDEADSVLIDDAMTPLILSQQVDGQDDFAQAVTAISLARRLEQPLHFSLDAKVRRVVLSEAGETLAAELVTGLEGPWKNRRFRHELIRQGLSAIHLFRRDVDYLVRDGEVLLIDHSTGRLMQDRKLQHGLHQMIETKERCELTQQSVTIASLSFQRFFQRYHYLCGMTGTAQEAKRELRRVYGLSTCYVPPHQPSGRKGLQPRFALSSDTHYRMVVEEVSRCLSAGQPVLIGTRTLAQSEALSAILNDSGIRHTVLNARQDQEEASTVAKAGEAGTVTVATNMAGRGTDIPLGNGVADVGGLHVVIAALNENRRIDRQLLGRAARQGDPGSYRFILEITDEVLARNTPRWLQSWLAGGNLTKFSFWHSLCLTVGRLAQKRQESRHLRARAQVAKADLELQKRLAFSGYKE